MCVHAHTTLTHIHEYMQDKKTGIEPTTLGLHLALEDRDKHGLSPCAIISIVQVCEFRARYACCIHIHCSRRKPGCKSAWACVYIYVYIYMYVYICIYIYVHTSVLLVQTRLIFRFLCIRVNEFIRQTV
jgi:hypothetical protein